MIKIVKPGAGTISNVIGIYKNSDEVMRVYHGTDLVYLKITYVWQYRVAIDSAIYTDVGANGNTTANPTITAHIELRQAFSNNTYGPWSILSGGTVTITYAGSSASNGGTLNTTTGKVTADGRGTTTGDRRKVITVTITATGDISSHPTASTSIDVYLQANEETITSYGAITLSGNFTASGGTVTASATNLVSYTSGSSGTVSATCVVTSSGVYNKFTVSGASVTHRNMGKNETTDTYTLTVTNGTQNKSLNYSITNYKNRYINSYPSTYGTPVVTCTSNSVNQFGGSAVLEVSVMDVYYYNDYYTSGAVDYNVDSEQIAGSSDIRTNSSTGPWNAWTIRETSSDVYTITHLEMTNQMYSGLSPISESITVAFKNHRTADVGGNWNTTYTITATLYRLCYTKIKSNIPQILRVILFDSFPTSSINITSDVKIYNLLADINHYDSIEVNHADSSGNVTKVNINTNNTVICIMSVDSNGNLDLTAGYFYWNLIYDLIITIDGIGFDHQCQTENIGGSH